MTRSINAPICVSVPPLPRILALRRVGEAHTLKRAPFLVYETQVVVIPGITGALYIDQCAAVYQHDLDLPLLQRDVINEVAHAYLSAIVGKKYLSRAAVERPGHHDRFLFTIFGGSPYSTAADMTLQVTLGGTTRTAHVVKTADGGGDVAGGDLAPSAPFGLFLAGPAAFEFETEELTIGAGLQELTISLSAGGGVIGGGHANSDFSHTLTFAPTGDVFALPLGFQVNGPGVVNNRFVATPHFCTVRPMTANHDLLPTTAPGRRRVSDTLRAARLAIPPAHDFADALAACEGAIVGRAKG